MNHVYSCMCKQCKDSDLLDWENDSVLSTLGNVVGPLFPRDSEAV